MEEMEEEYLIQETARIESLRNKAVGCFSTRLISERLVINLTAYTEIKLYRTGNRARMHWWMNMDHMIRKATGNENNNNNNGCSSSHE